MDIGINTLVDLDVPFEELLQMISSAGFTHISLCHDIVHSGYHLAKGRERVRQLLAENSLALEYIHTPLEPWQDMSSTEEQVRRITVDVYKFVIACTAEMDGRFVVAHACGRRPVPGEEFEASVAAGIKSAGELADYACERGLHFCIENLPVTKDAQRVTHQIMKDCDHPGLRFCLDPCHVTIGNDDPLELVRWMSPKVVCTHMSDTMGERDSHLIPGEGVVDFPGIAKELGKAGFNGVVDLECSLWMLRRRERNKRSHPGDPVPCSTEHYLEKAADAAKRISGWISENAKPPDEA